MIDKLKKLVRLGKTCTFAASPKDPKTQECELRNTTRLLLRAESCLHATHQQQHRLARLLDRCRNTMKFVRESMVHKYNPEECDALDDQLVEIEEWLRGKEERPNRPFHPLKENQ